MTKEELEKENAELKGKLLNLKITQIKDLERKIASQRGTIRVYNDKLKSRLEQVERLKQENKKLREENIELKGEADGVLDNWCKGDDPCPHLKKRDTQLTKAKELISKKFMEEQFNAAKKKVDAREEKVEENDV